MRHLPRPIQKQLQNDGYKAHEKNQPVSSCPHGPHTMHACHWQIGWWMREYEINPASFFCGEDAQPEETDR
jgi:hypothetical protein